MTLIMHTTTEPDLSYFGLQSYWGITKHMGGLDATDHLLALARAAPGQTVLDIGCGVGMTACALARDHGLRVVGIDRQPGMVAWARWRARREGVQDRVQFQVADAQSLPFDDETFDLVMSESVTAFVPDKPRALREYQRVTRRGGAIALNEGVWTRTPPADVVAFAQRTMDGVAFQTAEAWAGLLTGAGLTEVITEVTEISPFQEWRAEVKRVGLKNLGQYLTAWGKTAGLYRRSAAFRRYIHDMRGARRMAQDLFKYYGYGLYVGRKAA